MGLPQPRSILLVEDDQTAREIIGSMLALKFPGADIYLAADGSAGVELFQKYQPDMVITDINMPKTDGVQLIRDISALRPDTGIIVITAHSDRQNLDRINSTGSQIELVPKPVDFNTLLASIHRSCARPGSAGGENSAN